MNANPPALPLPAEMALLLHRPDGSAHRSRAALITGAAEIGELALLGHIGSAGGTKVQLLDARPTGVPWQDAVLAGLAGKAGPRGKPINLGSWLQHRRGAFHEHRELLVRSGLLRHERSKALGFVPVDKYVPEPQAQRRLVVEVRDAARGVREIDARLATRCALVHVADLGRSLGCPKPELAALKEISRGNGLSEAVRRVLEASSAAVMAAITAAGAASTTGG